MLTKNQSLSMFQELAGTYFDAVSAALGTVDLAEIEAATGVIRAARDCGGTVFIAGNGGSAATASHWVNDLGKATKKSGRAPIRVMGLADNVSWLSALGNDEGYDRVFAGQLENFARPGDVLIVISASGNSPNLVRAVEMARERGVRTIGLLGFDGGALLSMVDQPVLMRTEKGAYELVEDVHCVICHAITRNLVADRAETAR